MEIVIDTNFAVSCARQKIDFFDLANQIIGEQIDWIIPSKIVEEIKKISIDKKNSIKDRHAALLFLEIIKSKLKEKGEIKQVDLDGSVVDDTLVDYCLKNPKMVLATLDKKLKSRIPNRILTIKGTKFLRID